MGTPELVFSRARLRAWRHLRKATYDSLGDASNTAPERVAACEAGTDQPSTDMLAAWASELGCQPDQLRSTTPQSSDEYWKAANEAMGPMSPGDLAAVAEVILRSRARAAAADEPTNG